jgi:hypothetical protein
VSINILLQKQNQSRSEKARFWIYEHPTTVKVLKIAGIIGGFGLLSFFPFTAPFLGLGARVGLSFSGALLSTASLAALFALDLIVSPHHDMKKHVYQEGECDGGRLFYENDVPILTLDSDDSFKAGKAHGYLCGNAISCLLKRYELVLNTLAKQSRANQLPHSLAAIRQSIPPKYLREMEGLVEGFNRWAQEQYWWQSPKKLSVDDVLLFHLIPDSLHFQPAMFERRFAEDMGMKEQAVACTAIVDQDPQRGFVFARNMDWPSFGLSGAYSIVMNRKHANGLRNTVEVAVPGFIGTITGMNDQGLALAMNVCVGTTSEIRGMPASLYNRACLEECPTVGDVEGFVQKQAPLGSYHLTVSDRNRAESIHFYQSPGNAHVIRPWKKNQPLSTLNCRYSSEPYCAMHHSDERQQLIDEFFHQRENKLIEDALSLPFVNNWITTHRVVMEPQSRRVRVAFDNAFAGKAPLHEISTQRLFQN